MAKNKSLLINLCCFPVHIYRYCVSPCFKSCCRFYPTCSEYALQAIQAYGPFRGTFMSVKRLLRCHPWSEGGYDPIHSNQEKY